MKTWKKCAAAICTALTLSAPLTTEAHWLSSRQEKEIGTQAANDFAKEYPVSHHWLLEHIQKRIMLYNSDKLWMYGTPGQKRGLEPVLMVKNDVASAIFDHLATKTSRAFSYDKRDQNPWKKSNIYQLSAMAAVMGHEIGHWENEDMLRQYDAIYDRKLLTIFIPAANI